MKVEKPAVGILKNGDWGDTLSYLVVCGCGDPDHSHNVWIEVDDTETVSVVVYTTNTSTFWSKNRWRQMWELLTKGYVQEEVSLLMSEQQALNYANTLTQAVGAVKIARGNKLKEKR